MAALGGGGVGGVAGGERTSDVALTFGWLLGLLLLQLPTPFHLQHGVLVLGLPVDVTGGGGGGQRSAGQGQHWLVGWLDRRKVRKRQQNEANRQISKYSRIKTGC